MITTIIITAINIECMLFNVQLYIKEPVGILTEYHKKNQEPVRAPDLIL